MTEDFVSYDLAVQLKAAGFDWKCADYIKVIPGTEREEWDEEDCQWCTIQEIERYPKATLWQAQKWLRDVHHISVRVNYLTDDRRWFADWLNLDTEEYDDTDVTFATYEEALSAGITAALELIEKKGE